MIIYTSKISLTCLNCSFEKNVITKAKHISIDEKNKNIFLDDKTFNCKNCKSARIIIKKTDNKREKDEDNNKKG